MPELPEVETIAANLRGDRAAQTSLIGQRICSVCLLWERTLALPGQDEFLQRLPGQTIQSIGRRGKFLLIQLSPDFLLIHLRMSGDLFVEAADAPLPAHTRLHLAFESSLRLSFTDTRKFGRVWLAPDPKLVVGNLGPEPLDPAFTVEAFTRRLLQRRRRLKPLLLDQEFLAGLGNIYTDEALHRARLHPNALSHTLSEAQAAGLFTSIRETLQEGILRHGASIDWVYRGGDFQNYFRVYQRNGEPCPVCSTPIVRIVIGQRSTHFCPTCQKPE